MAKKPIKIKKANKGKLHRELKVKGDKKLTDAELQKAAKSKSPAERKRATFAENARKWNHK